MRLHKIFGPIVKNAVAGRITKRNDNLILIVHSPEDYIRVMIIIYIISFVCLRPRVYAMFSLGRAFKYTAWKQTFTLIFSGVHAYTTFPEK
jgi:hypothetical protein